VTAPIEFKIDVIDTGRIQLRLDAFPRAVQQRLKQTIGQLTHRLLASVQAAEPVRTGRLRQETHAFVDQGIRRGMPWVRGRVRVLAGEGNLGARFGALEYGGPGIRRRGRKVEVKAYTRGGVRVMAYERRQPTIRAMRFLRGPAIAQRAAAVAALEAALNDAIGSFNKS
jgi:hypothetical protein